MSVYVITGVSKGIGFEFVKQISQDPNNLVIGLVRDKATTEKKLSAELGVARDNIHILTGDLTNHASLKQAALDTASIVGSRGVDYLVANAAYPSLFDAFDPIGALADNVQELEKVTHQLMQTNVIGNIHLFNLFLPLVLQAKTKKVITLTSGHADLELINGYDIEVAPLYAASKAAMNVIVAKYSAQYKRDGVLFVGISPGVVDVGHFNDLTPEQIKGATSFVTKMAAYAPDFKGPVPVDQAVRTIRETWEKISLEDGFGGAFISHLGNKQWV